MDEYLIQGSTLTDIADAIREKTGDDALMTPAEMVEAIAGIVTGGGITPEYYEYNQAEAWTTDATGNAVTFCNTFLNHGYGLYRAVVENNGNTGFYAKRATLFRFNGTYLYVGNTNSNIYGSFTRFINTSNAVVPSSSVSFYLRAGAVIKVFRYPVFGGDKDFDFPS